MTVSRMVTIIKSVAARELFKRHPEVKKLLWGGSLWTSGYYANTVGQYASAEAIVKYVKNQGKTYKRLYQGDLFGNG